MEGAVIRVARTFKFLAVGAISPFSGFAWSPPTDDGTPGVWNDTAGPLALARRGIHVCRAADLAYWLHDELWETEVDGDQLEGLDCLVVRRARLVRRIDAWSAGGAHRFAQACIAHAVELAGAAPPEPIRQMIDDAEADLGLGYPAVSAYGTAVLAGRLAGDYDEDSYRRERAWQAGWLTRELLGA